MFFGLALLAAVVLPLIVFRKRQWKGRLAVMNEGGAIAIRMHHGGLSWSRPSHFAYSTFESFKQVSIFKRGIILHSSSSLTYIPASFLGIKIENQNIVDLLKSKTQHIVWPPNLETTNPK